MAGAPMMLCSDGGAAEGVLTDCFARLTLRYSLTYGQVKWLAFSSLEYSDLPGESFFEDGDFNRPHSDAMERIERSRKAYLQLATANAFSEFETAKEIEMDALGW